MTRIDPGLQSVLKAAVQIAGDLESSGSPPERSAGRSPIFRKLRKCLGTLERRFEQQRRIHEVISHANSGVELDEILNHVYESFRSLIPYDRIGLALLDGQGSEVRCRWGRSEASRVRLGPGYALPLAKTSLSALITSGRPRILNDLEAYLECHPDSKATRLIVEEGMRSSLTCPLIAMGKAVGFLFFNHRDAGAYRPHHVEAFVQIAEQVAIIVEKARLYEQLRETNAQLEAEIRERTRTEALLRRAQGKLRAVNRELDSLASLDGLTGVSNRRSFDDALRAGWERAIRNQASLTLILVDVDCFKSYNDTYGHLAGDQALRVVARALHGASRNRCGDLIARYGGEEFAVLLSDVEQDGALRVAERMRLAVRNQQIPHGSSAVSPYVTISLGVATAHPQAGEAAESLVGAADHGMYAAKEAGRDCVRIGP